MMYKQKFSQLLFASFFRFIAAYLLGTALHPSVPYIFCSQKRPGMIHPSHGIVKTNRLPCPGAGSTDMVPWCSSAMARTKESPKPEPPS